MFNHPNYEVKALYKPTDVLKHIGPGKKEWDGIKVRMNSQRYKLFKKSCKCVRCGIEGTRMYLEKPSKTDQTTWHFNLYAVKSDGSEVMMTKDHIVPKSKGGPNTLENYQTMCLECNSEKADEIEYKFMIAIARTNRLRDDFMVEFTSGQKNLIDVWNDGLDFLWANYPDTQTMRKSAVLHAWQNIQGHSKFVDQPLVQGRWWVPIFVGKSDSKEDTQWYSDNYKQYGIEIDINKLISPYNINQK